jgi:MerR family mercuric resistance operon transcriptional regulator
MARMMIGQAAKAAGVSVETIRFYERKGLVEQPERPDRGRRTYPTDLVERVRFIRRAKELGFSLREIAELLDLGTDPETTCGDVRARALAKVADIEDRIASLETMKRALGKLTATCPGEGPTTGCPILGALGDSGGPWASAPLAEEREEEPHDR